MDLSSDNKIIYFTYFKWASTRQLVPIAYAQKPSINAHVAISSGVRSLILHLHTYFVYTSSEGSDVSAHLQMRRLV